MPIQHVEKQRSKDGETEYTVVEEQGLAPWSAAAPLKIVGHPQPRLEGAEKVTGRARYTYDIQLPGQLYARVLRSPHPHARITRIDTAKAEQLPGVRAVLSLNNAPDMEWYKEGKLFESTVRFVGDEVVAVAADSEEIADDALRLIEVEYEVLPFVASIADALKSGAPLVHKDAKGNIAGEVQKKARGDVAKGFREADVIVEGDYTTQTALHNSLEPHGTTATWEGEQLTLWASTQSIWQVREDVAEKLKLPAHHVRVIKQFMGGGFGSKQIAWKQDVIAALLSKAAGRPVQLMLDRHAENLAAGNRNATHQHVKIGAKRDGTLTAIDVVIELETGAYQAGGEASEVSGMYQTLYLCSNVRTEQTAAYTNVGPAVAFRAPGFVEAAFAFEQAMDELAHKLDIDPVALRLKNYVETDQDKEKPYTTPEALRRCYERVSEAFGWPNADEGRKTKDEGNNNQSSSRKRRGIGFAAHDWMGGKGNPPGYAWIKLNADGSADVITGTQDIGTGARTGLAQVAAEDLGLPLDQIALHLGDTANGPYSPASAGSATQPTIGSAIRAAAADVKRQLIEAASPMLEEEPNKLAVDNGKVYVKSDPTNAIEIAEVCGRIAPHMIQGQGAMGALTEDKTIHTVGAQCVEVEVDTETGEVTVLRVAASHDCGRMINPMTVDNQIIGGVTQGIGFALLEERIVDQRRGYVLNANLEEYKVPTVLDIPPITHARVNLPDLEANPTGAKGIGEPPLIPTAPAIANAVFDAIGVRIRHAPLSRDRIIEALNPHALDAMPRKENRDATI